MKTIKRDIVSCYSFKRQMPGSEGFATVTLLLEPNLDVSFIGGTEWDSVIEEVVLSIARREEIGIKVTVLKVEDHPIDGRASAYRYATEKAIMNALGVVG